MKRNVLNSPHLLELKKKRRRFILSKILISIFALLAIFAGLVYISRIPVLNIKSIEILGSRAIDIEMVRSIVEKEIAGDYLWFFPKTNLLFYPKKNIKKEISSQFRRLQDVNLKLDNSKILYISLTEREGKYIWCGEDLPRNGTELKDHACSFMDADGYVFAEAPYFSGEIYFKFYGPLMDHYFSPDIFGKIIAFKDTLITLGIKPAFLYTKNDEDIEIYLASNTSLSNSPKIILRKDFDLEKFSLNLEAALNTEPLQSNFKNKYSSLEYIDLRFGNKVYYKFR